MNNLVNTYIIYGLASLVFIVSVHAITYLVVYFFFPNKRHILKKLMIYSGVVLIIVGGIMTYTVLSLNSLFN